MNHFSFGTLRSFPGRDWTEDFPHENGNYLNNCVTCKRPFVGHKRRPVCYECSTAAQASWDALSEVEKQAALEKRDQQIREFFAKQYGTT